MIHGLHPYPAKRISQNANRHIKNTATNDLIIDPFCGSGNVLVESKLTGISGYRPFTDFIQIFGKAYQFSFPVCYLQCSISSVLTSNSFQNLSISPHHNKLS